MSLFVFVFALSLEAQSFPMNPFLKMIEKITEAAQRNVFNFCPGDTVYKTCGTACQKECNKPAAAFCTRQCVEGCFCPEGKSRFGDKCYFERQCPITSATTPHGQISNPPQPPKPIGLCPGDTVYQTCGTACPKECNKPAAAFCTHQCVKGCFCPEGKSRSGDKCYFERQCPITSVTTPQGQISNPPQPPKPIGLCPGDTVYKTCGTACPKECGKPAAAFCTHQCVAGCFCPYGKSRSG